VHCRCRHPFQCFKKRKLTSVSFFLSLIRVFPVLLPWLLRFINGSFMVAWWRCVEGFVASVRTNSGDAISFLVWLRCKWIGAWLTKVLALVERWMSRHRCRFCCDSFMVVQRYCSWMCCGGGSVLQTMVVFRRGGGSRWCAMLNAAGALLVALQGWRLITMLRKSSSAVNSLSTTETSKN